MTTETETKTCGCKLSGKLFTWCSLHAAARDLLKIMKVEVMPALRQAARHGEDQFGMYSRALSEAQNAITKAERGK